VNNGARNRRWAGWSAILAFGLFATANALWAFQQPAPDAGGAELLDFYGDLSGEIEVGGPLSLVSIALVGVFASALRPILTELEEGELFANMAFAGALLGLAAGVGAESINFAAATRAGDGTLTEESASSLFDVSYMFGSYAAAPGFGLLTFAIGAVALQARALLPRWLAIAAVIAGIALVTPFGPLLLGEYTVAPTFVLLLILGLALLRDRGSPTEPSYARS
jgi:hypothetical protein